MIHRIFIIPATVLLFACQNQPPVTPSDPWAKADRIVSSISLPDIPERTFFISDFGGIGDGFTDNKPAFDSILTFCAAQGGGKIVVEEGIYLINGPIHLGSHMNLHLDVGAKLVFGSKPEYYLPAVLTSWEGTRCYNYSPFIYAINAQNIAITGAGEIDGEASESFHPWKEKQDPDKVILRAMNNDAVPLEGRQFGAGHYLRPHLIQFYECADILVEDVLISDAPFWCLHFVFSKNITVRKISFEAFNYNNDGIDPESSENILIEDITFNNRDDNIAIKAGRDLEARTLSRPSRNIVIRNCRFRGHNAIAVGSEMSGGVYNVFVEDCSYAGKVVYGFYLKGNRDRGGTVRDIYARNIEFDSTRSTIIIDSNYKNQGSCCPPLFKNVNIKNLSSNHASDHGIYLKGFEEMYLDSITIRDVDIASAGTALGVSFTDHLQLDNVRINGVDYSNSSTLEESPAVWLKEKDPQTGREVWQITTGEEPSVVPYFERQAFTADEKYVVHSTQKNGEWGLYRTDLESGKVLRITDPGRKLEEDEYTVMPDGRRVCYLDGWKLYATSVYTLEEEVLFDYTGLLPEKPRFTGSFTNDGLFTLVYSGEKPVRSFYRTQLVTGEITKAHERSGGRISHAMINPADPNVITYVPGPDTQNDMSLPMEQRARTWKVDLEAGTDQQFLTMPYGYRATHESWTADGERFFFFRKTRPGWEPAAICSINKQGGDFQMHYESHTIKLGHGTSSRDGRWFISDSQLPGKNELVLINLNTGDAEVLCWPNSSTADGNTVLTHVHPSFSPGGNYVCFTSDRSGVTQFYVVPVGDLTNKKTTHEHI